MITTILILASTRKKETTQTKRGNRQQKKNTPSGAFSRNRINLTIDYVQSFFTLSHPFSRYFDQTSIFLTHLAPC